MIAGTMVNIALLLTCAFPLSRPDMPGRIFFVVYFLFTMFFSGGIIPNYVLIQQLGMKDSRLSLIIPFAFSAYNMIIVMTYFRNSIPAELYDSGRIDGCTDISYFFKIAIPLSTPVIAVVTLIHAIGHWNGYFRAMMYINTTSKFPLQLVLRDILFVSQLSPDILSRMSDAKVEQMTNAMDLLKYSVIVVGSLPVMVLYPFIQKYFVKGMMIGSIKG